MESLVPECWRDAIVAGRCRKSSTSFVAGGLSAGVPICRTHGGKQCVYVGPDGRKALRTAGCAAYQVRTGNKSQEGKTTRHRGPANAAQPRRRGDRVRQNLCSA